MKYRFALVILSSLFLLTACPIDRMLQRNEFTIKIENTAYENIFVQTNNNNPTNVKFDESILLLELELEDKNNQYTLYQNNQYKFYQDADLKCYLFSSSSAELRQDDSVSQYVEHGVFIIEKEGLRVISQDEYERLKPAFKPHPYDPSLCKVKED